MLEGIHYLNIGFRSANAIDALKKLRDNRSFEEFKIKDAYAIIQNCEKALCGKCSFKDYQEEYNKILLGDLEKLRKEYHGKDIFIKRVEEITHTKSILERIINKEEVSKEEIEEGIKTFEDLSKKCLDCSLNCKSRRI